MMNIYKTIHSLKNGQMILKIPKKINFKYIKRIKRDGGYQLIFTVEP